jgi:hypothetical protein
MKRVKKFKLLLLIIMMSLPVILLAQPDFDDGDDVQDVPFDGGVTLLIAAGVGYGLKKAHDNRKAEKENS